VRELDPDTVVDATGRILTGRCPIYPVFDPSRKIVEQLFEIELPEQLGPWWCAICCTQRHCENDDC
jgi:hypothetical protein